MWPHLPTAYPEPWHVPGISKLFYKLYAGKKKAQHVGLPNNTSFPWEGVGG